MARCQWCGELKNRPGAHEENCLDCERLINSQRQIPMIRVKCELPYSRDIATYFRPKEKKND